MNIMQTAARRTDKGFAFIITLFFVTASLLLFGGVMYWASTNAQITQMNQSFTKSEAAAEAATEKVFATMNRDFLFGSLNPSNTYSVLIPDSSSWPVQYTFSDTNGNANSTLVTESTTNWESLNAQYKGLNGYAVDVTIASVATPQKQLYNVPATVSETLQAASIPVFQFAIFYNLNMEMDPTPTMIVNGSVFCNQNMWITDINGLTFNSTVQAVGKVTLNTATDPIANNGYSYGGSTPVTFNLPSYPSSGNSALTMPIGSGTNSNPANVETILNLPPTGLGAPNIAAYAPSNQSYLFNEADLIVSNAATGLPGVNGTNITIWFQDQFKPKILTPLTNNVLIQKVPGTNWAATNILYAGFSFITNVTFYDWRENWNGGSGPPKTVQAVQIDIGAFNKWLTNAADEGPKWNNSSVADAGHGIGSIYVYNNVPLTKTTLPAVRLTNGAVLPAAYPGLTVVTPMPVYIYGNYNISNNIGNDLGTNRTTHTRPAAVLADAITILSPSWIDTYTNKLPAVNIDDTVNAALFEGIVQSNPNVTYVAGGPGYSGGVENVLRYLEDWSGNINTYNGSIVVMFPSIYASNSFIGGGYYYNPPSRHWAFDLNFTNLSGLPPLSPSAKSLIRNNWSAY